MSDESPAPQKGSNGEKDTATALALMGLAVVAVALLAFLGVMTSFLLSAGIILVIVFVGGLAAFHYFTWGRWLSKFREEEEERERESRDAKDRRDG